MPQYQRKETAMVITAGIKPAITAGRLCDASGNFLNKTQQITKGVNGSWPATGWSPLMAETIVADGVILPPIVGKMDIVEQPDGFKPVTKEAPKKP